MAMLVQFSLLSIDAYGIGSEGKMLTWFKKAFEAEASPFCSQVASRTQAQVDPLV
ncbi:uncharacterized protein PGTG_21894 [Puccinia graminis f. sp. tritici CRL 75-36-700-3]|uniref:Uncharacterized protein n=1 Tax=Puccinia graminis f. sp. tritici (strain CRL 75-36-700-3 / race SCCL) TaxID=418459 RepID=H6QTE3_PUCGT|nr:uncharacterized protein PGTG_21894 [Puccinia graminis f. sp. tritici CRL 75-36-700-3]EHS64144.1 hypothetical protein PGTG_21894 [Puccinia graminis f. sp. tritici CRL 75-36-700-3]